MHAKRSEQAQAIQLRRSGLSLNEIAKNLGVAKSSVSVWVRAVPLRPSAKRVLLQRPFSSIAIAMRRKSRLEHERLKRNRLIAVSAAEISTLTNDELRLAGTMLYWAEGGKTQRMVRFSNGDARLIRIAMRFFREICNVPEARFRGHIHIYHTLDHRRAEKFWSVQTGIPLSQFYKTYRKPNVSSKGKRLSLPNGVMDIYIQDVSLFLRIMGWIEGVATQTEASNETQEMLE